MERFPGRLVVYFLLKHKAGARAPAFAALYNLLP
jgi:hypothetical protein